MLNTLLTKKAILKSDEMSEFTGTKCVLTISVGQPNHEGDKLLATILAINKHFSSCIIMVCDSLQRYTMQISSLSRPTEIHKESNISGYEWILRNNTAIKQLKLPHQVSRWDFWLDHPCFDEKRIIINELYKNDTSFKNSIFETSEEFMKRNHQKAVVDSETAYNLSKNYLLEECSVMLLLADEGYQFEIYPTQRNDAMDYVYKKIISGENRKLMRAVSIKFKNLAASKQLESSLI